MLPRQWLAFLLVFYTSRRGSAVSFGNANYRRMRLNYAFPKANARYAIQFDEVQGLMWIASAGQSFLTAQEPHLLALSVAPIPTYATPFYVSVQKEPETIPYEMDFELFGSLDRNQLPFSFFRTIVPEPIETLATSFLMVKLDQDVGRAVSRNILFNGDILQVIRDESAARAQRNIDSYAKIFVVVHDWLGSPDEPIVSALFNSLINYAGARPEDLDCLSLLINWESGSQSRLTDAQWTNLPDTEFYSKAAANSVVIGRQIGLLLNYLVQEKLASHGKNIHIIGIGLGAHLGHFACDWFRALTMNNPEVGPQTIGRLTALDPSSLGFEVNNMFERLSTTYDVQFKNSAEKVDVIHTTSFEPSPVATPSINFQLNRYGFARPLGVTDFYPNLPSQQPGCLFTNYPHNVAQVGCNQNKAVSYFIDSLARTGIRDATDRYSLYGVLCNEFDRINLCQVGAHGSPQCFATMGIDSAADALISGTFFLVYASSTMSKKKRQVTSLRTSRRPPMARLMGIDRPVLPEGPLSELPLPIDTFLDIGFAVNVRRAANGRQAPPNELERFDSFPFDRATDVTRGIDIDGSPPNGPKDMKDCGRFRAFPESSGRVFQGYKPYNGQFPWTVCMYTLRATYTRRDRLFKPLSVVFDVQGRHDDPSHVFTLKGNGWPGPQAASQCTGSVVNRNWILTAAHCFDFIPNGVPIYLAIGGVSCLRPLVVRYVTIDKRPDSPSRTVFMTPNRVERTRQVIKDYVASVFDGPCANLAFDDVARDSRFISEDIALIKLNEPLPVPDEWSPGLINAVCLQAAAKIPLDHQLSVYHAGYGLKLFNSSLANQRPSLNMYRATVQVQEETYSGPIGTVQVPLFPPSLDQFLTANVDFNRFNVPFNHRQTLSGDSGGPVVRYAAGTGSPPPAGAAPERAVQVGIMVKGVSTQAEAFAPSGVNAYTLFPITSLRVATYLDFINEVIAANSGASPLPEQLYSLENEPQREEPTGDDGD